MDVTSLRNQRQSIISESDLVIYDEILVACENNLYRAAYILAWIAIVESLKRKIYTLADLGDKRSDNLRSNIEEQEKNKCSTDKTIFEGSITCEIVPIRYRADLDFLWQQRCLYGHPYQYTPLEKDVRWIIEKALEITLTHDLMYTHKRVEEFLKEELNSFHIVPQDKQLREIYILRHLSMIQEKHYALLFRKLCYHIETLRIQNNNGKKVSYLLSFVRLFVTEKKPDIKEKSYRVGDGIANWPITMWYVAAIPEVWSALADAHKMSLFQYFDNSNGSEMSTCISAISHLTSKGVVLNQQQNQTYYRKLDGLSIADSWQSYHDKDLLLSRIEKEWVVGRPWGKQGAYVDWLTSIDNNIAKFEGAHLYKLGEFVGICCRDNAFVAKNYVDASTGDWFAYPEFNRGVAKGILTYQGKFCFANNCVELTISFLASLPSEVQVSISADLTPLVFEPTNIRDDKQADLENLMIANDAKFCNELKLLLNDRIKGCFAPVDHGN